MNRIRSHRHLLLRGGTLPGPDGAPVKADVLVTDGEVVAVGSVEAPPATRLLDIPGAILLPALVAGRGVLRELDGPSGAHVSPNGAVLAVHAIRAGAGLLVDGDVEVRAGAAAVGMRVATAPTGIGHPWDHLRRAVSSGLSHRDAVRAILATHGEVVAGAPGDLLVLQFPGPAPSVANVYDSVVLRGGPEAVRAVIVDGEILFLDGRVLPVDEDKL